MRVAADSMGQSILQRVPYSNGSQAHVRYNMSKGVVLFLKPSITFSTVFQFKDAYLHQSNTFEYLVSVSAYKKCVLKFLCFLSLHCWCTVISVFRSLDAIRCQNIYCVAFSKKK